MNFRAAAAVVAIAAILASLAPLGASGKKEKPEAPGFELPDLHGKAVSLAAHKGKVVLVNFWSVDCPPCRGELPGLNALYDKMKGKPFEILAVTTDSKPTAEAAARDFKIKFPVLLDTSTSVTRAYTVYNVPTTYIVDKDGKIDNKILGPADWADQSVIDYMHNLIEK